MTVVLSPSYLTPLTKLKFVEHQTNASRNILTIAKAGAVSSGPINPCWTHPALLVVA